MIKLGAAVKQSPTSPEIDPLSMVDVVVMETSRGSSQTPVPVAEVAEGLDSPSEHSSREELSPTVSPAGVSPSWGRSLTETPLRRPIDGQPADPTAPRVRASVPVTRQGPPARPRPSVPRRPPAVPEVARQRSPAHTRPVPDTALQRSPAHTRPPVPQRPPAPPAPPRPSAVPEIERQRSPAHTFPVPDTTLLRSPAHTFPVPDTTLLRSPAHTRPPVPQRPPTLTPPPVPRRPPVPASPHAVQEAPKLAHRRPQVPMDSSRPSGETRDTCPRAVLAPVPTRSTTRPRIATSQRVAQEAPKLAHGRSRPPLGSPSRPCELASVATSHDAPVMRPVPATHPVPVFKATKVALQRTPERYHPTARPARPPQQRTPVRPHYGGAPMIAGVTNAPTGEYAGLIRPVPTAAPTLHPSRSRPCSSANAPSAGSSGHALRRPRYLVPFGAAPGRCAPALNSSYNTSTPLTPARLDITHHISTLPHTYIQLFTLYPDISAQNYARHSWFLTSTVSTPYQDNEAPIVCKIQTYGPIPSGSC
ncbi:proteoglycan 4-like [Palaemon carinicauda]|uniref:proteoglycan 4-like n=1 Tax=Palaemon carinicauda TaxID=392227 RepID=UPI0035B5FDA4